MLSCLVNNNKIYTFENDPRDLKRWADKNILLCPVCNKPYAFCNGRIRIPYFRHKDKNACSYEYTIETTNEHMQGQIDLYNWIKEQPGVKDAEIESWISETKQRPDIKFYYNDKLYVIEYQCTPISSEYLDRHLLYKAAGITDIWICGCANYLQKYYKGKGSKRLNHVENETNFYYDPCDNSFYIVPVLTEYEFKHVSGYELIKNKDVSFYNDYYWPSPTGYRSNKHPYKVSRQIYEANHSYAQKIHLSNLTLGDLLDEK